MSKHPRLVYSPEYHAKLGLILGNFFPIKKYQLTYEKLLSTKKASLSDFAEPKPLPRSDLERVHEKKYLKKLEFWAKTPLGLLRGENPVSQEILEKLHLVCGGTYLAGKIAISEGAAYHLSGGLHHAKTNQEGGFCLINDVAVAIRKLQAEDGISKVLVIDCDLHQGDGTAQIFADDPSVFTFSIYQEDNFPPKIEKSDLDIGIPGYLGKADFYLEQLQNGLQKIPQDNYEIIFYVAGVDVLRGDRLGDFKLDLQDLRVREEIVLEFAKKRGLPIGGVMAGGYNEDEELTVLGHLITAECFLNSETI